MKFAFLDESGKAQDDVSVIAGVVIDSYRIHSTRREWIALLESMASLTGKPIDEFHMRNVYSGRKEWASAGITNRATAINSILDWLANKGHPIVFGTTLKTAFESRMKSGCGMISELGSRWVSEAFHIALSINKAHKGMKGNKGKSVLVFDRGSGYEQRLSELLVSPPSWSDSYYSKQEEEEQLGEIMDTSFFADSLQAPLIQLADAVAFILRRLAEIKDVGLKERFNGEVGNLEQWLGKIKPGIQPAAHRYKKSGRCKCANLFWDLAPPSLRDIR